MSVQLTEGQGGMGGRQLASGVGWEVELGHPWSSHDANRHPHNGPCTLVGHRDIQSAVGVILGPHHLISALHWYPSLVPLFQM